MCLYVCEFVIPIGEANHLSTVKEYIARTRCALPLSFTSVFRQHTSPRIVSGSDLTVGTEQRSGLVADNTRLSSHQSRALLLCSCWWWWWLLCLPASSDIRALYSRFNQAATAMARPCCRSAARQSLLHSANAHTHTQILSLRQLLCGLDARARRPSFALIHVNS